MRAITNLPQNPRREPGLDLLRAGAIGFACLPFARIALPGAKPVALLAFSLYLTHRQVYAWLDDHLENLVADAPLLAFGVYQAVALTVAALLHVAVERPTLRLRDRWLAKRAASATPGACTAGPVPCVTLDTSTLSGRE